MSPWQKLKNWPKPRSQLVDGVGAMELPTGAYLPPRSFLGYTVDPELRSRPGREGAQMNRTSDPQPGPCLFPRSMALGRLLCSLVAHHL